MFVWIMDRTFDCWHGYRSMDIGGVGGGKNKMECCTDGDVSRKMGIDLAYKNRLGKKIMECPCP